MQCWFWAWSAWALAWICTFSGWPIVSKSFSIIGKRVSQGELGFREAAERLREISQEADLVFYNAAMAVQASGTDFQKLYIIAASSLSLRLGYEGFTEMDEEKLEAASKLMEFVLELTEEFERKPLG